MVEVQFDKPSCFHKEHILATDVRLYPVVIILGAHELMRTVSSHQQVQPVSTRLTTVVILSFCIRMPSPGASPTRAEQDTRPSPVGESATSTTRHLVDLLEKQVVVPLAAATSLVLGSFHERAQEIDMSLWTGRSHKEHCRFLVPVCLCIPNRNVADRHKILQLPSVRFGLRLFSPFLPVTVSDDKFLRNYECIN